MDHNLRCLVCFLRGACHSVPGDSQRACVHTSVCACMCGGLPVGPQRTLPFKVFGVTLIFPVIFLQFELSILLLNSLTWYKGQYRSAKIGKKVWLPTKMLKLNKRRTSNQLVSHIYYTGIEGCVTWWMLFLCLFQWLNEERLIQRLTALIHTGRDEEVRAHTHPGHGNPGKVMNFCKFNDCFGKVMDLFCCLNELRPSI